MRQLGLAVLALMVGGCAAPKSDTITAREINLVDDQGQTLITLSTKKNVAAIGVYSSTQKDASGKQVSRFIFSDGPDGHPSMHLQDASGKAAMLFFRPKDGWVLMADRVSAKQIDEDPSLGSVPLSE